MSRGDDLDAFNFRWRYVILFFTIATGWVTLWEKCGPPAHRPPKQIAAVETDSSSQASNIHKKETTSVAHKHHSAGNAVKPVVQGNGTTTNGIGGTNAEKVKAPVENLAPSTPKPTPLAAPLERAEGDDIEFRLMRAEGNIRAQTIKMTVVLVTSAADWNIRVDVQSIIDDQGNEYPLKSFMNGASAYDTKVVLNTGVPIRCTFTFGGVLPSVGTIKLFKIPYWGKAIQESYVEFRDIPIQWK